MRIKRFAIGLLALVGALTLLAFLFNLATSSFRKMASRSDYYSTSYEEKSVGGGMKIQNPSLAPSFSGKAIDAPDSAQLPMEADRESTANTTQDRMVIKTADLAMKVKNVEEQARQLQELVAQKQGFIASSSSYESGGTGGSLVTTLVLRLPSTEFENFLLEAKKLAVKVVNEKIGGQDVTDEYVDLTARLRNLEATRDQFLLIMKKAEKIPDILEVQRELSRVTGEIEVAKGRMQYLEKNTAMATVTVRLSTEEKELPVVEEGWDPIRTIKNALRALVAILKSFADAIIWSVVLFGPFVLLGALLGWIIIKVRRGKK